MREERRTDKKHSARGEKQFGERRLYRIPTQEQKHHKINWQTL